VKTLIDVGSGGSEAELTVAGRLVGVDVDPGGGVDARRPHAVLLQRLPHIEVLEKEGRITVTRNTVCWGKDISQVVQLDKIEALFKSKVTERIIIAVIDHLHAVHVDVNVFEGVNVAEAPVSKFRYSADVM